MAGSNHASSRGDNDVQLDRSNGRVQVVAGRVFYSPNCSRTVFSPPPPPPDAGAFRIDIFAPTRNADGTRNLFDLDIRDYHNPRWWTLACGWASFIPLEPQLANPALEALLMIPRRIAPREQDNMFVLSDHIIGEWRYLQNNLQFAVCHLQGYFEIAAIRPFLPFRFAFDKPRRRAQTLLKAMYKARDWYIIWTGLLSFIIAQAETKYQNLLPYPFIRKEPWDEYLASKGMERRWLDSIKSSMVYRYELRLPRVGAFLHLNNLPDGQPDVLWFSGKEVPVWYLWEAEQARDSSLSCFAPLPFQLQEGTQSIPKSPTSIAAGAATNDSAATNHSVTASDTTIIGGTTQGNDSPSAQSAKVAPVNISSEATRTRRDAAWFRAFFEERMEARSRLQESDQQRQIRLAREKQPPTKSAKVYKWIYGDNGERVREPVPMKWRESTLEEYSQAQRRYDSHFNEWDCCSDFGDSDDGSDADSDDSHLGQDEEIHVVDYDDSADAAVDFTLQPSAPVGNPPNTVLETHVAEQEWLPKALVGGYKPSANHFEDEILEVLRLHFGFTPPLPAPSGMVPVTDLARRKNLVKLMGFSKADRYFDVFTFPRTLCGVRFLDDLKPGVSIPEECDMSPAHREHVAFSSRFSAITVLSKDDDLVYMFDFKERRTVPWNLTVLTASHALMICRLPEKWNEQDIAHHLLKTGTPFRTLQSSRTVTRSSTSNQEPDEIPIPSRPANYTFTIDDYASYLQQRSVVHRRRRARAALMRGGYLWRACIGAIGFNTVFAGPTGWSPDPEKMFLITSTDGEEFIDDNLLESEIFTLLGLYRCSTVEEGQIALKSWSPLVYAFEGSGVDYGRWTQANEELYSIGMTDLEKGATTLAKQPCNAKKWRDICRGLGAVRTSRKVIEQWARELIRDSKAL